MRERFRVFQSGTVAEVKSVFGTASGNGQRNRVIRTRCLGKELLHNRSYLDIKYIFTSDKWEKSFQTAQASKYILGEDSIHTSQTKGTWPWHRALLRPHFARTRIADLDATEEHIARVVSWIEKRSEGDEIVDFQDVAYRFTLTTASQHFCGHCLDMLNSLLGDRPVTDSTLNSTRFSKAIEDAAADISKIMLIPSFLRKIVQGLMMPNRPIKDIFEVIDQVIPNDDLKDSKMDSEETPHAENLVVHLKRSGCSREIIKYTISSIIVAARDTSASLLTSCIFELAGRDELWSRLRLEVENIPACPDVSLEQLHKLKQLRAVINETLRFHTVTWHVYRYAFEDHVLPSGTFVPAGTECELYLSEIHRDPSVWGEDADEFVPDRWLDGRPINHAAFLPFTAGPRVCIGQQFAITEVTLALVRLLQAFTKVELVGPLLRKEDYKRTTTGVTTFKGGVPVKFHTT